PARIGARSREVSVDLPRLLGAGTPGDQSGAPEVLPRAIGLRRAREPQPGPRAAEGEGQMGETGLPGSRVLRQVAHVRLQLAEPRVPRLVERRPEAVDDQVLSGSFETKHLLDDERLGQLRKYLADI